jgi:rubrerythrin
MSSSATLVERLGPLLAEYSLGEQLYVVALLESRSAERYREWAGQVSDAELARGLRSCAEREDDIAERIRKRFATVLAPPSDFARLAPRIQEEVASLFGGHSREEQFQIQAQAERGGQQFWTDLAAGEKDEATKRLLLECAVLEEGSAKYLESLGR